MPSDKEQSPRTKRKLINAAVMATILGILVSGALGLLGLLQHERAMERDDRRFDRQWALQQARNAEEDVSNEARFAQDLQMRLQTEYLAADSLEDLLRLERSLEWIAQFSPYQSTKPVIAAFQQIIQNDLKTSLKAKGSGTKPDPNTRAMAAKTVNKLQTLSQQQFKEQERQENLARQKVKQDANIKIADMAAIKQTISGKKRTLILNEIICIDPQSNWPKNCDQIYLKINDQRIWKEPKKICRGERLRLNEKLPFDDKTEIELWEYDKVSDDLLGSFKIVESLRKKTGIADIKNTGQKGAWHYLVKFTAD